MSRRRGIALLIVVLFVAGVVGAVVVGRSTTSGRPPLAARPVPAPAGSLRVGVPSLAESYNPFDARARTPAATQILTMVLPQLFDVAPDGSVQGRLAADVVDETPGAVHLRLAPGARWSDGLPITAADLAFTLRVVRATEWPGPDAGYDQISSIRGSGRDVVMRFSSPLPAWRRLFSGPDYVLPKHRLDGADLKTVWASGPDLAGGPFTFKGSTPGYDVVLGANPEWWGQGPGVKNLQVLTVPDATTLQQLFERKKLDVVWMPAFTDRTMQMRAIDGADVSVGAPGGRLLSLWANTEKVATPVRTAALDLVDRDRFVDVLFGPEAKVASSWGMIERPVWRSWSADPSKAQAVAHQTLQFVVPDEEPLSGLLTRAVQRKARGTSLDFDVVSVESQLLDGEWLAQGKFDLALVDEVEWPQPCRRCRFGSAHVGETDWSRADGLSELAQSADHGNTASAAQLETDLRDTAVVLPLWRPATVVASRGVDGIAANSWAYGPFYRPELWVRRNA